MTSIHETLRPYGGLPETSLSHWLESRSDVNHAWRPNRFNFCVGANQEPRNNLQRAILSHLKDGLTNPSVGCILVDSPGQETKIASHAQLVIVFSEGLEATISPWDNYYLLHRPHEKQPPLGLLFMVNTVEQLPDTVDFDFARQQIVRKSCHNGVIFEGDPDSHSIKRALWISTQGNFKTVEAPKDYPGEPEEYIFENVLLHIMAHYGSEMVNRRYDAVLSDLTWKQYAASFVHQDIATAAQQLGEAGIIEDSINLKKYVRKWHAMAILEAMHKAGLGESMRSAYDPNLGLMLVTRSGPGKVKVSPNPLDGHLVPVSQITRDGYVVTTPTDAPIKWVNSSVETHESGETLIVGAAAQAGEVGDFEGADDFLERQFENQDSVDVVPKGYPFKVTQIDHFHWWPDPSSLNQERDEIVYPDTRYFPWVDWPCGSKQASRALLSAFFLSPTFSQPGPPHSPLNGKFIFALLPGHGTVVIHDGPNRQELTNAIINEIRLVPPEGA